MKLYKIDKIIGILCYSTTEKGIGGKLRKKLSDFKVQEVNKNGKVLNFYHSGVKIPNIYEKDFEYLTFNLQKMGMTTPEAVEKIANATGLDSNNFYFSGFKDKRAITVQEISVKGNPIKLLTKINNDHLKLFNFNRGSKIFEGEHLGNFFTIIIRDINLSKNKCRDRIEKIWNEIESNGLLNYFGYQRFGSIRPISHIIGKDLVKKEYENALRDYLTFESKFENKEIANLRKVIKKDWPNIDDKLIKKLPDNLDFEKKILYELKKRNNDYKNVIFSVFGTNLIRMFVHAYQSYLFNKILSFRFLNLKRELIEGDVIIILDYQGLPTDKHVILNQKNYNVLIKLIKSKKAVLGIPLLGKNTIKDENISNKQYIKEVINQENLKIEDFDILNSKNKLLSFMGGFRPAFIFPKNFKYEFLRQNNSLKGLIIKMKFFLQKGTYATIFMRELMKTNPLDY
ncbi:MAG: tRNA pseudouridine(13) synthase TruD [Candidatus Helarchaeota archaeon]